MTDPAGESVERPENPLTTANRFELLVQSVTDYAIYMLDTTGIVTSWNSGAQRFKGYAPHEIIGEHFSRFYTDEERAAGIPAIALHTAETEGRFEAEGWRIRKDGTRFWANVVIDPIRDPEGTLIGFAKVTRDLTERRAAEEELRRSEERFRLLIESVTDYAIYMLDPSGKVVSWNPGAQRFKGYRPEEIIGEHFSRFYTDEDRQAGIPARALATAEAEGRFEAEGWRVRKDGSRFWANVVIDPIRSSEGRLIGFAKVTRDLSERRAAQLELEKTREAFFQSQKMDAIGKLTGGVAHDFNNLLSIILGSLHFARRRLAEGADVSKLIDNSITAAQRGASLTQRMLAFARKQELQLATVELSSLVEGMADLLERTIGPGVTIKAQFPAALPPVRADARQLELALLNLAVNARDAMPTGGTITIGAEIATLAAAGEDVEAEQHVRLWVRDDGEGMDEDVLGRATEPFFTTKGVGKGTGLGLSMVHGLVEQSGGRFSLKSAPGQGTTVEMLLRVAAPAAETQAAADEGPAPGSAGPLAVLAVDDDALVLENTVLMLEDLGHVVTRAASGSQALKYLRTRSFDLLITDYAMPKMTGDELARAARAAYPELPVLIVSGYAEIPAEAGDELPRIAKPFDEDALRHGIADALAARRNKAA
jgi:PAS domain S-box-containing protein